MPTIEQVTKKYLQLRDQKAEVKARHKQELKPIEEAMEKIEAWFLKWFEKNGGDSIKIRGVGTPYTTIAESYTVADRDAYLDYVAEQGAWELLDVRVNKTAAREFKNEHSDLPPGVNYSAVKKVNVRSD